MTTLDLKHCPICNQDLPVSEFGLCRARKDGRNLYCKSCIREKVTQSRRALRGYKAARKKYRAQLEAQILTEEEPFIVPFTKLTPAERVKLSIERGSRTQREIAQETKLGKDVIGDSLATLILWTHEIRTEVVDNTRLYFIRQPEVEVEQPQRKDCVLSLSCFGPVIKHERVA